MLYGKVNASLSKHERAPSVCNHSLNYQLVVDGVSSPSLICKDVMTNTRSAEAIYSRMQQLHNSPYVAVVPAMGD